MKLTNTDIETMLIKETKDITPEVLSKVKAKIAINDIKKMDVDEEIHLTKKNIFSLKKLKVVLTMCVAILFVFLIPTVVYGREYESITIDVNPSIEINTNRFNRVTSINYNNEDAYNIFSDLKLKNLKVEDAIVLCYDRLYQNNYLNNEENIIIISGYAKGHEFSETKLNKYSKLITEEAKKKEVNCVVKTNKVTSEDKEIAKENDMSIGKLKLINMILDETDEYQFESLKDLSMKDLKTIYLDIVKQKKDVNDHKDNNKNDDKENGKSGK